MNSRSIHPRPLWWHSALVVLRAWWPLLLAALAGLALLFAFTQVVASVAAQGDLQRRGAAAQNDHEWRCRLISDRAGRETCLAKSKGR